MPDPSTESGGKDIDPLSFELARLLSERSWTQSRLADSAGLSTSSLSRLLKLKGGEAVNLKHIRKIFEALAPDLARLTPAEIYARLPSITPPPGISWDDFLDQRFDAAFENLASALAGQLKRKERASSKWVISFLDEGRWQLSHIPSERWIITDAIAELEFQDLFDRTRHLLKESQFERLVFIMPKRAISQFRDLLDEMHNQGVTDEVLRKKVFCISIVREDMFLIRMRVDDPTSFSGEASGVMAARDAPVLFRLSHGMIADIRARFGKVVRHFVQGGASLDEFKIEFPLQ
jgi:DNA-binding Xre family transcriptional regulator